MRAVNVAELKDRLSHYLREVKRGESVLVRDRDRIIARIDPAGGEGHAASDENARLGELEARGILRRGRGRVTPAMLARRPRVRTNVVAALLRERDEGR